MNDKIECPICGEKTNITYNWILAEHNKTGLYYHECLKCENVFTTKNKVEK